MSDRSDSDAELELKKRARRRLVGAVALALLAAIVLPMVMDQTPPSSVQPVELRIPGQEQMAARPLVESPAGPQVASASMPGGARASAVASEPALPAAPLPEAAKEPAGKPADLSPAVRDDAPKTPAKETPARDPSKQPAKEPAKEAAKTPHDSSARESAAKDTVQKEAERARAILAGQPSQAAAADPHVILIGAFSNPANVKTLQGKLAELGIKVYTEKLASPQGDKTRVRAGPFANRDAAEKALAKMKRIGVGGIVASKP